MELARWGLRRISRISDRYRGFKDFLADVLEGERSLIQEESSRTSKTQAETHFQTQDDIDRLRYALPLNRFRSDQRPVEVFKNFAPFFEAGFLLREQGDGSQKLESMFLFGKIFAPPDGEAPVVELPMPRFESSRVYRGRVKPVLKVFRLDSLRVLHDAVAFALSPRAGVIYLLVCNRPHPWQVAMLEKTHLTMTELLGPARV